MARTPAANIHWRAITAGRHLVEDAGRLYIVHDTARRPRALGRRAVAYWAGHEAVAAQDFLARRAARDRLAVSQLRPARPRGRARGRP